MLQREKEKAALVMELRGALTKAEEHSLKAQIIEKLERTKAFQRATEDGNRRCLAMEEAFSKLKQITGVSSLVDMHEKFSSQVGDKTILLMEVKEAEMKLEAMKATQLRQLASFEEMQSSNSNFNNHNNHNNNNHNDHTNSCGSSSGKGSIRLPSNGIRLPSSGMGNEYIEGGKACTTSTRVAPTSKTDITSTHSAKSDTNTNTNSNISGSSGNSNNNSNNNSPRNLISPTPRSAHSLHQQRDRPHDRTDRSLNDVGHENGNGMKWDRSGSAGGNDTVHRVRAANDQYVISPTSFISLFLCNSHLFFPCHFQLPQLQRLLFHLLLPLTSISTFTTTSTFICLLIQVAVQSSICWLLSQSK